ncbi:unnamed protein product [Cunninghamella blakesleeana]
MYNNFGVTQQSINNNNINPSGGIRLNFITPSDQTKFEDFFKRAAAFNGGKQVTANAVRDILVRSRLDNDSLAKIWDLSSIAKAPYLTFPEFAVAMYLTSTKLTGKAIPNQLPPNVREETEIAMATLASTETTSQPQQLINTNTPIIQNNLPYNSNNNNNNLQLPMMTGMPLQQQLPMMTGLNPQTQMMTGMTPQPQIPMQTGFQQPYQQQLQTLQPQMQLPMQTGYVTSSLQNAMPTGRPIDTSANKLRLQNNDFASKMMPNQAGRHNLLTPALGTQQHNTISWKISPEERQRYSEIFYAWETSSTGYLSGDKAREVFLQSGLLENDLMKIWSLADKDNKGSLDADEFAIAMHLIYRKLNNFDIPNILPTELAPPSSVLKKFVIGHKPAVAPPSFAHSNSPGSRSVGGGNQNYYNNNDGDEGDEYVSSARRKGPNRFRSNAPSRRVTSYDDDNSNDYDDYDVAAVEELRLQISDTKKKLNNITSSFKNAGNNDTYSASSKYSVEELKEGIRKSHHDLGRAYRSNPLTSRYLKNTETLLDLLETQKSLQDEIQYLCNRDIPVLARQLRSSATELRDAKVRHGRKNDGGQDYTAYIQPTGPGGAITESDRVRAKAKAMMAARKIGTGSSKDASYELKRAEEEKQEYDRIADNAERDMERSREALRDLHGDLRYLSQVSESSLITNKKRFENGQDMSYELRRFIEQLNRDAPLEISPPSSPTTINRQYHSSTNFNSENTTITSSSSYTSSISSSAVPASNSPVNRPTAAPKPRTAEEIKKEAERRVQERLEALRAKHNISSPKPKPSAQPSTPLIDPEEQASQQRLREAEQQAQAKIRESAGNYDTVRQSRDNQEAELQRQQLEQQRKEDEEKERQKQQEEEKQRMIDEEKEYELRRQAIIKKEEEQRLARLKAIEAAEAAEEAKKQANQPSVAAPPAPAPPAPVPPPAPTNIIPEESDKKPTEVVSENTSPKKGSNNPFAMLQGNSNSTEQASIESTTTSAPEIAPTAATTTIQSTKSDKRISYNPFAAFSAFSATKAQDSDSDSESDDGWDVVQQDDSEDEDEFPAAGSAKNLAGKLFDAMIQRQNTGSPQQFASPVAQNASIPAPPPPPVASDAVPPPPPPPAASDAIPPPPPPPAVSNTIPPPPAPPASTSNESAFIPSPPATGGSDRNALLSQIQLGTKLKKAVTNDRSQPSVSGKIVGSNSNNNESIPVATAASTSNIVETKQEESVAPPSFNSGFMAELQARASGGSSESPVSVPPPPTSSSIEIDHGKEYIALWDYEGQGSDDLSFKANAIILVKDGLEADDWWYGTLKETQQSGYFPRNYVDNDISATNGHQESELNIKGKALYDYDGPEEEGCLKIGEGESLTIINKSLGDWFMARLDNGKEGLVPANYILEE